MILLFTLLGLVVSQCMNNGVRHDMSNDYICECALDWTGKNCDVWTGNLDASQKIGCNFVTIPTEGSASFDVSPHNVDGASCTVLIGQSKHYTAVVAEALAIELSGAQNPNPNFYFVAGNHHPVLKNNVQATIANNYGSFKMSDIPTGAQSDAMVEVVTLVYVEDEHSAQVANYPFQVSFDIDECIEGSDDCHVHATCTNTNTGYTCECDQWHTDVSTGDIAGLSCIDNEHKALFDECDSVLAEVMGDKVEGENTLSTTLTAETLEDEVSNADPKPLLGELIDSVMTILTAHDLEDADRLLEITNAFDQLEMNDVANANNLNNTIVELDAKDAEQLVLIEQYNTSALALQVLIDAEEVAHATDEATIPVLLGAVNTNLTNDLQALREKCEEDFQAIDAAQGIFEANQTAEFGVDQARIQALDGEFDALVLAMEGEYAAITTSLNTAVGDASTPGSILGDISTMTGSMSTATSDIDVQFDANMPYIDNWKNTAAGFTFELTTDMACCGVIKFNNNIFQTTPDFDSSTGKFTSPISGYYYFSYHIKAQDPDQLRVQLVNNQVVVTGEMVIKDNLRTGRDHLTMSSVAHVLKGETVHVKLDSRDIMAGSIFSGFLIQADPAYDNFNEASSYTAPMVKQVTAPTVT